MLICNACIDVYNTWRHCFFHILAQNMKRRFFLGWGAEQVGRVLSRKNVLTQKARSIFVR